MIPVQALGGAIAGFCAIVWMFNILARGVMCDVLIFGSPWISRIAITGIGIGLALATYGTIWSVDNGEFIIKIALP